MCRHLKLLKKNLPAAMKTSFAFVILNLFQHLLAKTLSGQETLKRVQGDECL